jgi:hypothetical protein
MPLFISMNLICLGTSYNLSSLFKVLKTKTREDGYLWKSSETRETYDLAVSLEFKTNNSIYKIFTKIPS